MPIRPGSQKINSKDYFKNHEKYYADIKLTNQSKSSKISRIAFKVSLAIPVIIVGYAFRNKIALFFLREKDETKSNLNLTDIDILKATDEEKVIGYTSGLIKKKDH